MVLLQCESAGSGFVRKRFEEESAFRTSAQPVEQPLGGRDVQRAPGALDESFASQAPQHQRYRLARRPYQLAQQLVVCPRQLDASVRVQETVVLGHALQCSDESLFHGKRRELAQLFEQGGALSHHLTDQCKRACRLLANECTQLRGAQEKG